MQLGYCIIELRYLVAEIRDIRIHDNLSFQSDYLLYQFRLFYGIYSIINYSNLTKLTSPCREVRLRFLNRIFALLNVRPSPTDASLITEHSRGAFPCFSGTDFKKICDKMNVSIGMKSFDTVKHL